MSEDIYQAIRDLGSQMDANKDHLANVVENMGVRLEGGFGKHFNSLEQSIQIQESIVALLDLERKVLRIDQAFDGYEQISEHARASSLSDLEREYIIKTWPIMKRLYAEVLTVFEVPIPELKTETWLQITQDIKKTWNNLDHAIMRDKRMDIVEQIQRFGWYLDQALAETLIEIDAHVKIKPAVR
jgi:hypothetical protein